MGNRLARRPRAPIGKRAFFTLRTPAGNVRQWIAPFRNRFAVRLWAQGVLPFALRGFDLTHFVKNLGVFGVPTRTVITVHDVTTLRHADIFPASEVWYWRHVQGLTLQLADRVIAVSQATARDIAHFYPAAAHKTCVIYNGLGPQFRPAAPAAIGNLRRRYNLPGNYIACVGRLDRKKNLGMLIEAFALFRARFPGDVKLVIAGEEYAKLRDAALATTVQRLDLKEQVIFAGRLPDEDVPVLFSGALLAVFPSLHEGFGLAAAEAMACGTPLVTSAAGGLVEVVADAAELVPVAGAEAFAAALLRVAGEAGWRETLRRRGLERATHFQRANTAEATLRLYREVVDSCHD